MASADAEVGDASGLRPRSKKLCVKWYGIEPDFPFGNAGLIEPRVLEIGKTDDPWHELPAEFLDKLLCDKSHELDQ